MDHGQEKAANDKQAHKVTRSIHGGGVIPGIPSFV